MSTDTDFGIGSGSRMQRILLVLWLATLGADRVDFMAGHAFFVATPFLVLSPLLLVSWAIGRVPDHAAVRVASGIKAAGFVILIWLFLIVLLASVLFGADPERGAVVYTLLLYETVCISSIVFLLGLRSDATDILLRGARLGVLLCFIFGLLEFFNWMSGNVIGPDLGERRTFIFLNASTIGVVTPRLSGVSGDPNRAGLLLLFYWFLLIKLRKSRIDDMVAGLAMLLLFCTLSRSAILSLLFTGAWMLIRSEAGWKRVLRWKTIAAATLAAIALCAFLWSAWDSVGESDDIQVAISDRFSADSEKSGGEHLELLRRGLELWWSTPKNVMLGVGYGSSAKFLSDIFQTKYANFHSIYISILAESGIVALAILIALMTYPLKWNTAWAPLMAGVIIFNVFYQTTAEPFFWLVVALMWKSRGAEGLLRSPIYARC